MNHDYYYSELNTSNPLSKMIKYWSSFKSPVTIDGKKYLGIITYNSPLSKKAIEDLGYKEVDDYGRQE